MAVQTSTKPLAPLARSTCETVGASAPNMMAKIAILRENMRAARVQNMAAF
jgi:hypothetical protein